MTLPAVGPCTIDIVLDHRVGVLRGRARPAAIDLLPAVDELLRDASAAGAGWLPVPHPRLALPVALGEPVVFARLTGRIDELHPPIGLVGSSAARAAARRR
ncbi:MAG: hypothetical protein ACR2H2_12540 [Solirubrobacteraceae bacterium]